MSPRGTENMEKNEWVSTNKRMKETSHGKAIILENAFTNGESGTLDGVIRVTGYAESLAIGRSSFGLAIGT